MTYTISKNDLYDRVDYEVSQAADEAYGDGGVSLYDAVVLTSKDRDAVDQYIDDAVTRLKQRLRGDATLNSDALEIDVPDIPDDDEAAADDMIDRYIVLYAITEIFQTRRPALVPQYSTRTQAALEDVISILRTRKATTRS